MTLAPFSSSSASEDSAAAWVAFHPGKGLRKGLLPTTLVPTGHLSTVHCGARVLTNASVLDILGFDAKLVTMAIVPAWKLWPSRSDVATLLGATMSPTSPEAPFGPPLRQEAYPLCHASRHVASLAGSSKWGCRHTGHLVCPALEHLTAQSEQSECKHARRSGALNGPRQTGQRCPGLGGLEHVGDGVHAAAPIGSATVSSSLTAIGPFAACTTDSDAGGGPGGEAVPCAGEGLGGRLAGSSVGKAARFLSSVAVARMVCASAAWPSRCARGGS